LRCPDAKNARAQKLKLRRDDDGGKGVARRSPPRPAAAIYYASTILFLLPLNEPHREFLPYSFFKKKTKREKERKEREKLLCSPISTVKERTS
jgi:hypothetical protein